MPRPSKSSQSVNQRHNPSQRSLQDSRILSQDNSQKDSNDISDEVSSSNSKNKRLSITELGTMVISTIHYILQINEEKHPILKSNIKKAVLFKTNHYNEVMNEVKNRFKQVFGYNLYEYDNGKYILINNIPNAIPHITLNPDERRNKVLLFLILSHIFMSEDSCQEVSLWGFLNDLGISTSEVEFDPHFGNVRQIILEKFIQQKYIDRIKNGNEDNECFEYKWGVRAEQELNIRQVLEFVEKVYNIPMSTFKTQYSMLRYRERLDTEQN